MESDLLLFLRSLPYLRPSQPGQRIVRLAVENLLLRTGALRLLRPPSAQLAVNPLRVDGPSRESPRLVVWRLRPEAARQASILASQGEFELLGGRRKYHSGIDWNDPTLPRLGRFELNAFKIAWAMAADDGSRWGPVLAGLVERWHRENRPRRGDPWHPFVVAERILSLLGTRDVWLAAVSDPERVSAGLWAQSRFLRRALEWDVGGNHIIRELVALAASEAAFDPAHSPSSGSLKALDWELEKQLLADGGHYERSPAYHLEVLTDLVELDTMLPSRNKFKQRFATLLSKMASFAVSLCHPDGQLAMFNDCYEWPVPPEAFLKALGLETTRGWQFPQSGYYVLGDDKDVLFLDAGPPSPRDLPPHAHCDLLSVEVSISGKRMIVNSGTGDYARGPWRDYWRSTRAHNTVEVDGAEQSEVWHSFRMARRATPERVGVLEGEGAVGVTAAHDGYRRLASPVTHRRTVVRVDGSWLVLDLIEGNGRHRVRSFMHLHPDVAAEADRRSAVLRRAGASLSITPIGPLDIGLREASESPIENWYAFRVGQRTPGRSLVLSGHLDLPAAIGWFLQPGADAPTVAVQAGPEWFLARINGAAQLRSIERDSFRLIVRRAA